MVFKFRWLYDELLFLIRFFKGGPPLWAGNLILVPDSFCFLFGFGRCFVAALR